MKILFYGDSNTYGYDPADLYEQRYPLRCRWTTLLQQLVPADWEIIPEGMNGRRLPEGLGAAEPRPRTYTEYPPRAYTEPTPRAYTGHDAERIDRMLEMLGPGDLFAVMLGTNDILLTMDPDADVAVEKMRDFLAFLTDRKAASDILVIAPPHIGRRDIRDPLYRRYYEESVRMNAGFRELAAEYQVNFADAGTWDVDMSADLVHLSAKGHRQFAERMRKVIT